MVYLQQQLPAIALMGQLLLMTLSLDGDGYLSGQQSGEFKINLIVSACFIAPEIKRTQALIRGRQRKAANCFDGMIG